MWNIETVKDIIKSSKNKSEVLVKLKLKNNGGNYNTLDNFIKKNNIDISHFIKNNKNHHGGKWSLEQILVEDSFYTKTTSLKERLYKEGIKKRLCELCGQDEIWKNKKISLILDHINGDRHDNRIENLRIVCPNCNASLETHCRGLRAFDEPYSDYDSCICTNRKKKTSKVCIDCYRKKLFEIKRQEKLNKKTRKDNRKAIRPSHNQLVSEIKEFGYVGVGKRYGVSDNSIRKWVKMYEKYGKDF
jgi:hypothetical protein